MEDFTNDATYSNEGLGEEFPEGVKLTLCNPTFANDTIQLVLYPSIQNMIQSPAENLVYKKKRFRTNYTTQQLAILEAIFEKKPYLTLKEKEDVAVHLNIPRSKIKVWFQNRRQKEKKSDHKLLNKKSSEYGNNEKQKPKLPILDEKEVAMFFDALEEAPSENRHNGTINLERYLEIFNK